LCLNSTTLLVNVSRANPNITDEWKSVQADKIINAHVKFAEIWGYS